MARTVPYDGHAGLSYFLHRAYAMTLEDARIVLSLETAWCFSYYAAWVSAEATYSLKVERFPNHNWNLMPRECYIAVTCYTQDTPNVADYLDTWCRGAQPTASSWRTFPYKSLWCFLLRAFQMLPDFSIRRVFRVVQTMVDPLKDAVMFTEFLCARVLSRPPYDDSGPNAIHQVLYFVPAYLVRDISLYSTREGHREVLIWPFCMFLVFQMSPDTFVLIFLRDSLFRHLRRLTPSWSQLAA